jgi:hypothetical protein
MTVIAWDGHVLAADRQVSNGDTRCAPITKILRVDDTLYASCGPLHDAMAIRDWLISGRTAPFPTIGDVSRTPTVLTINRATGIREYIASPNPLTYPLDTRLALGSGEAIAYAVMAMGHSAREAVEAACRVNIWCGSGIDLLPLDT